MRSMLLISKSSYHCLYGFKGRDVATRAIPKGEGVGRLQELTFTQDNSNLAPDMLDTEFPGVTSVQDRLCDLVVRVSGYRSRGPRVRFQALPDFLRSRGSRAGPLSLVRTI
jgi:hypothetical protein